MSHQFVSFPTDSLFPTHFGNADSQLAWQMLTDNRIKGFTARSTAFRVADTNGLCIEIRANGSKIWRYRYRHAGKATMSYYPDLGMAGARIERDRLRRVLRGGGNPSLLLTTERLTRAEDAASTFGGIANGKACPSRECGNSLCRSIQAPGCFNKRPSLASVSAISTSHYQGLPGVAPPRWASEKVRECCHGSFDQEHQLLGREMIQRASSG